MIGRLSFPSVLSIELLSSWVMTTSEPFHNGHLRPEEQGHPTIFWSLIFDILLPRLRYFSHRKET